MKIMCSLASSLVMILLSAQCIHGQDLSKYQNFSFGMRLVDLSEQVDQKPAEANLIHQRPAVIQELTWWPPLASGTRLAEPVRQILFSFYNGELYRILVTYDRYVTEGLTADAMVRTMSAKYGTATRPTAEIQFPHERDRGIWDDRKGDRVLGRLAILVQPFPVAPVEHLWASHVFETARCTS
jgi:hypothetical protein